MGNLTVQTLCVILPSGLGRIAQRESTTIALWGSRVQISLRPVFGALAQLGVRHTGSVEVSGSNPLRSRLCKGRRS